MTCPPTSEPALVFVAVSGAVPRFRLVVTAFFGHQPRLSLAPKNPPLESAQWHSGWGCSRGPVWEWTLDPRREADEIAR